jgi:hypothetical protein
LSKGTASLIIANNNLGHHVRFIVALEADIKAHVKNAYVKEKGQKNTKQNYKKGAYVYFYSLSPTLECVLILQYLFNSNELKKANRNIRLFLAIRQRI